MEKKGEQIRFKVILIGPPGAGKTSLLTKYVKQKFSYDYLVTTGIQCFSTDVKINEKASVKLQIWDTMGQQKFKSIVKSFYKEVAAVMLFYPIDKAQSLEKLNIWVREVEQNVNQQAIYFLVGTMLDLEDSSRKIPKQDGERFCEQIKAISFQEISSKTGENVKELFEKMAKKLFKKYNSSNTFKQYINPKIDTRTDNVRLKQPNQPLQKSCC